MKLSDLKTFFGVICLSLRTVKPYNLLLMNALNSVLI